MKIYFLYSEYVSAFSTTSSSVHAYMCVDPEVNQYAGWAYIGTVCSSNKKLRSLLSEWHYSDASSGVVRNKKKIKLLCIALGCMLYISTSFTDGCAFQTLVEIVIFSVFNSKKLKKARNLKQNFAKNMFFKFAQRHWLTVVFPKK